MKKNTILILLITLLFSFAFYWYEYRPTKIKEKCSAEARFDQRAISELDDTKRDEFIKKYYDDCMMRFGIK